MRGSVPLMPLLGQVTPILLIKSQPFRCKPCMHLVCCFVMCELSVDRRPHGVEGRFRTLHALPVEGGSGLNAAGGCQDDGHELALGGGDGDPRLIGEAPVGPGNRRP